jgi:predicted Zn-dependent protease
MHQKNKLVIFGISAALAPTLIMAQGQDAANKVLISQAQYWQAKNDFVRASSIWKKILLTNPNQVEAIYGVSQQELSANNIVAVNLSLLKLKKADPKSRYIALLEQDLVLHSNQNAKILDKARLLGESNKFDESIAQYDLALGGKIPQGAVGLEYYDRLGHTSKGWSAAKSGLERLQRESPNNPQIKLSLANLLIRNEGTRLEGAELLNQLSTDPEVGGYAGEGLKLALTWLNVPNQKAFPLFESYLSKNPNDAAVRAQLNAGIKQEQRLAQDGANSSNKPQNTRAIAAYEEAKKALQSGDDISARAALDKSLKLDPDNPWVRFSLANLYIKSGQIRAAKDLMYNMPYSEASNQVNVLFATALFAAGIQDWVQAQKYLDQIQTQDSTNEIKELQRSLALREQISQALILAKEGKKAEGLAQLSRYEQTASVDVMMISLLANAYIELGDTKRGIDYMRQAIARDTPPKTDLLLAYSFLLLKADEDTEAAPILATLGSRQLSVSDESSFKDVSFIYSLRQAGILRKNGKLDEAETKLTTLLTQRPTDPTVINELDLVYQASGKNIKGLDMYKKLIAQNPKNVELRLGAARLAIQMGNVEYANTNLETALSLAPNDPNVLTSAAKIYRIEGKSKLAENLYERSLTYMSEKDKMIASQNREQSNSGTSQSGYGAPTTISATTPSNQRNQSSVQVAAISEPQRIAINELREIKQEFNSDITLGAQVRNRSGNAGTSKLTDIEAPLEIRVPISNGKASIQVTPVSLNAGTIAANSFDNNPYGTGNTSSQTQTASGLGLSLAYKTNGVAVDAGTTPVGFTYSNFTGGIKLDGQLDGSRTLSYLLNVSSRPVTDSLLSFAGSKNSATGAKWGGVMASGARFALSKDLGGYGIYGSVGFYGVNGHNVESNNRKDFNLGTYINIYNRPDSQLTTGLNFSNMSYQQNLSNFTYGQGGYFSPQTYNAILVPLIWAKSSNTFSYQIKAGVGYQSYSQNSSNYFPTNATLQAASGNLIFPSLKSSGAAYNLAANSEYQLAPQFFFGTSIQSDNTATGTWHQWGAGAYLRYSFEPLSGFMSMPVKPFISPYGQ